jgi:3-oxoadipate enol-lactonase
MHLRANGIEIGYDVRGPGGRPWVVMIHGFPFTRATWTRQAETLAADFRVLTYDLRGLGESQLGPAPQPLEVFVDDLLALMDAVGAETAALVGLSMGGYIVLRALERAPARFWAAVLADTRAEADSDEGKLARAAGIRTLHAGGQRAFVAGFLPKLLRHPDSGAGRALAELMLGNDPTGMANALAAMQGRTDSTRALPSFALPTLVIVGEADTLTPPEMSRTIAARIPGARLEILPGAGHVSNLEAPEAFDALLAGFLSGVAS